MSNIERGVAAFALIVGAVAVVDSCRMVMQAQQPRTSAWAEAVEACEAHGGVAVPQATRVLGRSADLPACVRQLGD